MKKLTIISIIDDDYIYQVLTHKVIQSTGAVDLILQFQDGQEALEYLRDNQYKPELLPDLIFLDLQMPLLDGWQFLEEYINIVFDKNIKLYIVSSSNSSLDKERSTFYDNVRGFLVKPLNKTDILEVIENC